MRRGHRFLAASMGVAAAVAAGRSVAHRRVGPTIDDELLGSVRGEPVAIRGPRASRLYAERFPGRAGTVILTHGWCLTEAVWHYQKAALAEGGPTVVAWDLPGHGASTPIARGHLTLDLAVDALARVVDHFADPEGTVLVGHSLGGILTLSHLARGGQVNGGRLRGAVLVSTPLMHLARSVAGRWPGAGLEARALAAAMATVVRLPGLDRVFSGGVGQEGRHLSYRVARVGFGKNPAPSHVSFIRDLIASVPPQVRMDTFQAMSGYDLSGALPAIKVPTLVVSGGRDRLVNPAESAHLAARLPRATHVVFPDAGHAPFLEEHERFNAELRRFVDRRLSPRRRPRAAPHPQAAAEDPA
jgi:pimeloyl-ACP methyl ester carboxylesterase